MRCTRGWAACTSNAQCASCRNCNPNTHTHHSTSHAQVAPKRHVPMDNDDEGPRAAGGASHHPSTHHEGSSRKLIRPSKRIDVTPQPHGRRMEEDEPENGPVQESREERRARRAADRRQVGEEDGHRRHEDQDDSDGGLSDGDSWAGSVATFAGAHGWGMVLGGGGLGV
jgi:hypothetical protein